MSSAEFSQNVYKMNHDMVVFIGYYSPEQYELLLKHAHDRKNLDDKWEDWLVNYEGKNNVGERIYG